jgi:hypothetical protein
MKYDGKKILAKPNGNTYDIIEALVNITPQAIQNVKPYINKLVKITGNACIDAKNIATYIRKNVTYKADGYENQNIQLPGRLINDTKTGDCKSFSLLFCSMMKAAGHKAGYRFASYRKNKIPTHVYNWFICDNNFYTFDTCVPSLKESPRHTYIKDMDVNYLTGPDYDYITGKAERQAARAARKAKRQERRKEGKGFFQGVKKITLAGPRNAFRFIVSLNVRGLAKNLSIAVEKDKSKVEGFWKKLGGKFDGGDSLMQSINTGKNKKALFGEKKGVSGYDDEPYIGIAVETAIASATPIVIAAKKLLADLGIKPEDLAGLITPKEEEEAEASGNKFDDANFTPSDPEPGVKTTTGLTTDFKINPLLIGGVLGAGVLIYLLTKKKK